MSGDIFLDHDGEYSFVDPLVSELNQEYSSNDQLVGELNGEELSVDPLVHDGE